MPGIPFAYARSRARIARIEGFSAHGDYREMIDYLTSSLDPKQIKGTFLVHGEPDALTEYREHLREAGFRRLTIPEVRQEVEL